MPERPRLWHFTCDHGHRGIGKRGLLRPNPHVLMPALGAVVWLTSDGMPDRDDVGLTSHLISCDRLAYRYRVVDSSGAVPWGDLRSEVPPGVLADLERYAEPDTWWLSPTPVEAVLS